MNNFNQHSKLLLAASALLALTTATLVEAKSMSFKQGALTLQLDPANFATIMNRAGNAYNGVDSYGRPNEEKWQPDTAGTNNMVFDNGLKGIISGDAYTVRDLYFEDWFTSEEIAPLTAYQVMGVSKRVSSATIAYNLISLHNFNPLITDDGANLVAMHRLPLSEPWPKPTFKMFSHGIEPAIPANDNGGRNPQMTTAVFDDFDPVATFTGQIGVGGAFRVNGRYGHITVGDMALRYDPNRPTVNSGSTPGGKPGTDGWYITAHLNLIPSAGQAGVAAFETANTKVSVSGDTFVLSGNLVFASSVWSDRSGPNGITKAGKFRFVGKLMPTPN
ncbi:hypothetical protein [Methylocucumis oryzae]|uniref:Porin n=1 Tax=Methylocucumis oryzae TaxID=1632867 RepID=A0A0F3IEF0_9GAMM|nr:hypothetical protein [Methylocucumis oryzae]KJV05121.1 hypothetical protein VZ94_20430 [Methylocucumis oryzae]